MKTFLSGAALLAACLLVGSFVWYVIRGLLWAGFEGYIHYVWPLHLSAIIGTVVTTVVLIILAVVGLFLSAFKHG